MSSVKRSARDRLLDATAELIYAHGIEATGVDAIARAAGVTKRTLYQHFWSKDELVAGAVAMLDEPSMMRLRAAVRRRVDRGERPVTALFDVLARTFAEPAFQGCAFLNAGLEMREVDHPVRPTVRSHTDARRAASRREPATAQRAAAAAAERILQLAPRLCPKPPQIY